MQSACLDDSAWLLESAPDRIFNHDEVIFSPGDCTTSILTLGCVATFEHPLPLNGCSWHGPRTNTVFELKGTDKK